MVIRRKLSVPRAAGALARAWGRSLVKATRQAVKTGARTVRKQRLASRGPSVAGQGDWLQGVAMAGAGARRYFLYRPAGIAHGERVPLLVMLHGCGQDAAGFAASTRMNRLADREQFLVLYPQQERLVNPQGCWNWFDTDNGRAQAEVTLIMRVIDQVCRLYPVDREQLAMAGFSAGASMAALIATRHPERFRAVAMHSGVAPGLAHSATTALRAMRGSPLRRAVAAGAAARATATATAPATAPPATAGAVPVLASTFPPWPPLLVIQGGLDRVVAPGNGADAAQLWAAASGARAAAPRSVQRGQRHPSQVTDFMAGPVISATLVDVPSLAHAWSGGAAGQAHGDSRGPDASRLVWAFVSKRLRRPAAVVHEPAAMRKRL